MVALINVMQDTHVSILIFWIISNNRGQETTTRPGNAEDMAGRGAPYPGVGDGTALYVVAEPGSGPQDGACKIR